MATKPKVFLGPKARRKGEKGALHATDRWHSSAGISHFFGDGGAPWIDCRREGTKETIF